MGPDDRIPLTKIQTAYLGLVRFANRPGYIAHPRQGSLAALERRRLVASRPDPTDTTNAIWTITALGREWAEADERDR
jgi:hypothetical protein